MSDRNELFRVTRNHVDVRVEEDPRGSTAHSREDASSTFELADLDWHARPDESVPDDLQRMLEALVRRRVQRNEFFSELNLVHRGRIHR
ncbi:MAG: hypothetical protein R2878_11135 [Thermoleophilia bacterium]